jgi:hypothetical protein
MRTGHRPERPAPNATVAGRRSRVPSSASTEPREKGLSRRDLLVAGIGVATGVVTTGVTTFALDRLGPTVASSNLEALPEIDWSPDGSWLFFSDRPLDLTEQPDSFADSGGEFSTAATEFLVTRGCVRASPLVVNLHLSRPGNAAAVVRDIRVVNHRRRPALTGASYYSETAGSNTNAVLAVDLDTANAVPVQATLDEVLYGGDIGGRPAAFSATTFSVEPHLTESLTIGFLTEDGRHSFQLRLDYFVEGREHSLVIPADTDLLRVTQAVEAADRYELPWYEDVYRYVPVQ